MKPPKKTARKASAKDKNSASSTTDPAPTLSKVNTNESSILNRPYPVLSGRRSVPHLVVAGGFPFLRYKKPQPQILSQIISHRNRVYERRWDRSYELKERASVGELEDAWDNTLEELCGFRREPDHHISWAAESHKALQDIDTVVLRHTQRQQEMFQLLTAVREKERALAEQENLARKEEKRKQRETRRLARQVSETATETENPPMSAAIAG